MRYLFCVALLASLASPLLADKRDEELNEIQRDIASMDERVRDLQKAQATQGDKIEALHSLIQQAATAATQAAQEVSSLKAALTTNLADQQTKISGAVAPLGSRMDSVSQSMDQLNATIQGFNDRLAKLDKKLSDLADQVTLLKAPPPAPPAAVPDNTTSTVGPSGAVPTGASKQGLQESATLDYTSGRDELALMELASYVKNYPDDSWAPTAGFFMGMIYMRGNDYDSATQAFQSVIDKYPGNNMSQDAMFQKGMAYSKWPGHRMDAIATLKNFEDTYPANDNVATAKREIAKLQASPSSGKSNNKKGPSR